MKITLPATGPKFTFKDLREGDVFYFKDCRHDEQRIIWMKIAERNGMNCIDLRNGSAGNSGHGYEVVRCNAELILTH